MPDLLKMPKRILVGNPLRSAQLGDTLLPKRLALPVYCSDAISSNAYATQEILLVLALGGATAIVATPWIALVVAILLAVVTFSYRQTCYAYPDGGGAYAVSKQNLGQWPSLIAAAALLVDYVMTVAVSIASGVDNFTSAFPTLRSHSVALCLSFIVIITVMNLRGVKESGTMFAIPTYGFILSVYVMLLVGFAKAFSGHTPVAESAHFGLASPSVTGAALVILLLRAFASGCTSLTGVEAVSNGTPTFRPPKSRNASITLLTMSGLSIAMLMGIAVLSTWTHIRLADNLRMLVGAPHDYVQRTPLAQLSAAIFGNNSVGFFAVQGFTTLILVLAANTAFNGFPILASILANDRFLPKQMARRGDRLVYSNGIMILAGIAGGLIFMFNASVTRLIQLYILGVFVSFTLSQAGMVVHWHHERHTATGRASRRRAAMAINAVGAVSTALVLVIVLLTKFSHGAWLVVVAIPSICLVMLRIHAHYEQVSMSLRPKASGITLPSRIHAVVLVSQLNEPALKALAFARAIRPASITALRVDTNHERTQRLIADWERRDIPVPLCVIATEFRDLTSPVLEYLAQIDIGPRDVVEVFIPEYVVGHWWEQLLHNQSALRLKTRLLYMRGVMVTSVPYQLGSAEPYALGRPGEESDRGHTAGAAKAAKARPVSSQKPGDLTEGEPDRGGVPDRTTTGVASSGG